MTRAHFDQQLAQLRDEAVAVGERVARALNDAVELLARRDTAGAAALVAADQDINQRCHALERQALLTITTEAPMAGDVRLLAAVLDIANEVERVGDYAKGIAHVNCVMAGAPFGPAATERLDRMTAEATAMLRAALAAFQARDVAAARAVIAEDHAVDILYRELFALAVSAAPGGDLGDGADGLVERANYLVWVAHNLERAADRATNIAQRTIFTVTGDPGDLDAA
jgi:phosphate transport system protein